MKKLIAGAVVTGGLIFGVAGAASADNNTQTPNPSAHFGQAGSADDKLDLVSGAPLFADFDSVGAFMSDHVRSDVYSDAPGRSALAPSSLNANSNAG